MSNLPFMPTYAAAYLADTRHLTTEQHGAYWLMLLVAWQHGARLPNDEKKLARIAGLSLKRWRMISADVLALWDTDGEWITQKRQRFEYQKGEKLVAQKSLAGKCSAVARVLKNKKTGSTAVGLPYQHSESQLELHTSKSPNGLLDDSCPSKDGRNPIEREFDEQFWPIWPRRDAKKVARQKFILARTKKRVTLDTILSAARKYLESQDTDFICMASTWLNQERWNDEPPLPHKKRRGGMMDAIDNLFGSEATNGFAGPIIDLAAHPADS